jgi:two-component system OmpR family sensor kinase
MRSLRKTLLVSLMAGTLAVIGLGGLATYGTARIEVDALMDYQLRQLALSLRDQQLGRFGAPRALPPPDPSLDVVIQVWDANGFSLYQSHPHSGLPALARLGYDVVHTREGDWRAFSVPLLDRVIQVAQPMRIRERLAADAALRTVTPMLAMLPLLGVLIWLVIGRGLSPLSRLAGEVAKRHPEALHALPAEGAPVEVRPLVRALNHLLGRLDEALAAQRDFVADAAHELRTPLTALQIQLELAQRATDEATRNAALGDLSRGLERATHLVRQLLTLARQERGRGDPEEMPALALADIVRLALTDHAPQASAKSIDLGAGMLADAAMARGEAEALRTMVGNLIDNAIKYTPAGGHVDVHVEAAATGSRLRVEDSGPGVPEAERERVLDRFYRRQDAETTGSGLGLAIVQRIVERHGAILKLGEGSRGGLSVEIEFPAVSMG